MEGSDIFGAGADRQIRLYRVLMSLVDVITAGARTEFTPKY